MKSVVLFLVVALMTCFFSIGSAEAMPSGIAPWCKPIESLRIGFSHFTNHTLFTEIESDHRNNDLVGIYLDAPHKGVGHVRLDLNSIDPKLYKNASAIRVTNLDTKQVVEELSCDQSVDGTHCGGVADIAFFTNDWQADPRLQATILEEGRLEISIINHNGTKRFCHIVKTDFQTRFD